jgi:hypothetical protein
MAAAHIEIIERGCKQSENYAAAISSDTYEIRHATHCNVLQRFEPHCGLAWIWPSETLANHDHVIKRIS